MQLHDLAGKVALVTGSSTGIGAAVAKGFAQQGTKVAVHYNASAAEAEAVVGEILAAGGIAHAFKADMRSIKACNDLIAAVHAHYGRLDILVNNAGGVVKRHPLEDIDDELYDDIINLNARSVFACSRAAIPLLRVQGGGCIISTTSIAARTGGGSKSTLYAASKAFVSTFTRGLAKEVARHGIRVNAVAPGVIGKPTTNVTQPSHQLDASIKLTPMRRIGTVDECIGTYLFLASNEMSNFITGQVIEVNGGLHMP